MERHHRLVAIALLAALLFCLPQVSWSYEGDEANTWNIFTQHPPGLTSRASLTHDGNVIFFPERFVNDWDADNRKVDHIYIMSDIFTFESRVQFTTGPAPEVRDDFCTTVFGDKVVLFGGLSDMYLGDMNVLDMKTYAWKTLPTYNVKPEGRRFPMCVTHQNSAYIYAGVSEYEILNDIWKFDLENISWEKVKVNGAAGPQLYQSAYTVYKDAFYVLGGYSPRYGYSTYMFRFDFASKTWKRMTDFDNYYYGTFYYEGGYSYLSGGLNCMSSSFTLVGSELVIMSGYLLDSSYYVEPALAIVDLDKMEISHFEYYGTPSDFPYNAQYPLAKSYTSSTTVGNYVVYSHGQSGCTDDTVWFYDVSQRKFTHSSLSLVPQQRVSKGLIKKNEIEFLMFGGHNECSNQLYLNDLWSFNIETKKWTELFPATLPESYYDSYPPGLINPILGVYEDHLYVFGGISNILPGSPINYRFNLINLEWSFVTLPDGGLYLGYLSEAASSQIGSKIYMMGGTLENGGYIMHEEYMGTTKLHILNLDDLSLQTFPVSEERANRYLANGFVFQDRFCVQGGIAFGTGDFQKSIACFDEEIKDFEVLEGSDADIDELSRTNIVNVGMAAVVGGRDKFEESSSNIWFYDPLSKKWSVHLKAAERIPPSENADAILMKNMLLLVQPMIPGSPDSRILMYNIGRAFCSGTSDADVQDGRAELTDMSGKLSYMAYTDCSWIVKGPNNFVVRSLDIDRKSSITISTISTCKSNAIQVDGRVFEGQVSTDVIGKTSEVVIPSGECIVRFVTSPQLTAQAGFSFEFVDCPIGYSVSNGICTCAANHYITVGGQCHDCPQGSFQPSINQRECVEKPKKAIINHVDAPSGGWSYVYRSLPNCRYSISATASDIAYFLCLYEGDSVDENRYVPVVVFSVTDAERLSWKFHEAKGVRPPSRKGACVFSYDGSLIYIGGKAPSKVETHTYIYHTSNNTWAKKSSGPINQVGHSCALDNGQIYIHGGEDAEGFISSSLSVYNISTDGWKQVSYENPLSLAYHVSWIFESKMRLFGGFDGIQELSEVTDILLDRSNVTTSSDGEIRVSECQECSREKDRCQLPRQMMHTADSGQDLIIYGGLQKNKAMRDLLKISKDDNVVEARQAFPLEASLPLNAPPPAYSSTLTFVNKTMLLFGGSGSDSSNPGNWLWAYNEDGGYWKQASTTSEPLSRTDFGMAKCRDGFVVFGGVVHLQEAYLTNDMWFFNQTTSSWELWFEHKVDSSSPRPRARPQLVYFEDYLYVFGGDTRSANSDTNVWRYHATRRNGWQKVQMTMSLSDQQHILERAGFSFVMIGNLGYIWGGKLTIRTGVFEDYSSMFRFNFATLSIDAIKKEGGTPVVRINHAAGEYDDGFVIFGGMDFKNRLLGDVWYYNTTKNNWSMLSGAVVGGPKIHSAASAIFGDNLVIVGGFGDSGVRINSTWVYQIGTNSWIQPRNDSVSNYLPRLSGHGLIKTGDFVMLYGGSSEGFVNPNVIVMRPGLCHLDVPVIVYGSRTGQYFEDGSDTGDILGGSSCQFIFEKTNAILLNTSLVSSDIVYLENAVDEFGNQITEIKGSLQNHQLYSTSQRISFRFVSVSGLDSRIRSKGFRVQYFSCPETAKLKDGDCFCPINYYEDKDSGSCVKCLNIDDAPICAQYVEVPDEPLALGIIIGLAAGGGALIIIAGTVGWKIYQKKLRIMREREEQLFVHVKYSDLEFGKLLGAGSFGEVFAGEWRGTEVAIKRINAKKLDKKAIQSFKDEVAVMVQLRHPNIVLYMAACMEPNKLCIISELMFRGSLHDVLHDETTNLELPLRVSFLTDAAKGLQYLHLSSPPILHRDLKSPNLLLDEKMNVKISDFGLTGIQAKRGKGEEPPGTLLWMAPEVILGLDYTDKSDIYSFGIIMWEVLTRMDPYEGEEIAESVALRVAENNLRPEIPSDDSIPQELISLMSLCWDQEQEKRPSFTNVLKKMGMATDSSQSSMSFSMNIEATSSFKSQGSNARTKKQKAPLGTIALVFTDVQSSTSLWEKFHGDMATSLTIHNDIMRGCIRRNEGYEVRTEGDAFMVAFTSVKNAVMYCLQAQELLLSAEWPPGIFEHPAASIEGLGDKILFKGIRVRMGIHWCEPLYREDPMTQRIEYFGKPVIHANRVGDFPSGGQIVLSESAYEQIQNDLDDIGPPLIKDLGSQKLKGLEAEERLYEVTPRSISERSDYFSSHSREETFTKHSFTSETEGRDNGPSAKIFSWQINIDALTITKDDLGSGSFGTVYKGVYNGEEVAVKVLARQKLSEKQQFSLLSEISIML
eukprot:TRINITY_DN1023_c0_g1_i11.p1 TRINITY_DN1023_c0_g1~~TRINITY_DN1023_c0_g1_i11.p1  ORF type:complete len:2307 (+),score=387.96 TRINITY_DN1023_c0_g1_i11:43-6963(+)